MIQGEVEQKPEERRAEERRVQTQDLLKDLLTTREVMIADRTGHLLPEALLIRDQAAAAVQVAIWGLPGHLQAVAVDHQEEVPDQVVVDPEEAEVNKTILITEYLK